MNQTVSVVFGAPEIAGRLIIEQEQPQTADGYLSRAGMYMIIWGLLEGEAPEESICTQEVDLKLYVYRYDLSLDYKLHVSHGVLGMKAVESNVQFTEKLKFSIEDTASFRYPNFGIVTSEWLAKKVWDEDGNETTPPTLTATSSELTLSKKVWGTLAVSYLINRDVYGLSLPRREDTEVNKYSSVAYATHVGGPTWLELEPPPRVEEIDMECSGGGSIVIVAPDDPVAPPFAPNIDAETVIDYCTQEVTSESP